jgi:signal transduction histidine kinase
MKLKNKKIRKSVTTGEGTGLGLSLSYDIIKANDGEII